MDDERFRAIATTWKERDCEDLSASLDDPVHRGAAVMFLMRLGCREAAPRIAPLLDDCDVVVRRRAIRALHAFGYLDAVSRLREIAESDPDRAAREWAMLALVDMHDSAVLPLLGALLADPNRVQRRFAAMALRRLGLADAMPLLRETSERESIFRRWYLWRAMRSIKCVAAS